VDEMVTALGRLGESDPARYDVDAVARADEAAHRRLIASNVDRVTAGEPSAMAISPHAV
jgi:hypothetical protein